MAVSCKGNGAAGIKSRESGRADGSGEGLGWLFCMRVGDYPAANPLPIKSGGNPLQHLGMHVNEKIQALQAWEEV
jgi:hypothetical protein